MDKGRVKFKTNCKSKEAPTNEEVGGLLYWSKVFGERKYAPMLPDGGSAGNLSRRIDKGFTITCSKIGLKDELGLMHFAVVYSDFEKRIKWFENEKCQYKGMKKPSSEASLHDAIYSWRPEINAVFHGHYEPVVEKANEDGLTETRKEREFGTKELVEDVIDVLNEDNFIVLKGHGFVSMGETTDEAGKLATEICEKAKN